jgi:hypothetical protein
LVLASLADAQKKAHEACTKASGQVQGHPIWDVYKYIEMNQSILGDLYSEHLFNLVTSLAENKPSSSIFNSIADEMMKDSAVNEAQMRVVSVVSSLAHLVSKEPLALSDAFVNKMMNLFKGSNANKAVEFEELVRFIPSNIDPSRKAFFVARLIGLIHQVKSGSDFSDLLKTISEAALMDISEKVRSDVVSAWRESQAFVLLMEKMAEIKDGSGNPIGSSKIDSSAIVNKEKELLQAASVSATANKQGDVSSVILNNITDGYNKYLDKNLQDVVTNLSSNTNVNTDDFVALAKGASNAIIDAFKESFDTVTYQSYVSKKKLKPNKVYDPSTDAQAIGRSGAAFVIGCCLYGIVRVDESYKSFIETLLKGSRRAASKIASATAVNMIGDRFFNSFKGKLRDAGIETSDIDEMSTSTSTGNRIPSSVKRKMFIDFYEKFKTMFTSQLYDPNGIMKLIFSQYPSALSVFENSPNALAAKWNELVEGGAKNKNDEAFLAKYYIRDGKPDPIIGVGGFWGNTVSKEELKNVETNVDQYAIDPNIEDPNANKAMVLSTTKAGDIAVDRMIKAVQGAGSNTPYQPQKPPSVPGISGKKSSSPPVITKVSDLPNLPVPLIMDSVQAVIDNPGGNATQGSYFYAFCCGIGVADSLRVLVSRIDEDEKIKLSDEDENAGNFSDPGKDNIRLNDEDVKNAANDVGGAEPTQDLPDPNVVTRADQVRTPPPK